MPTKFYNCYRMQFWKSICFIRVFNSNTIKLAITVSPLKIKFILHLQQTNTQIYLPLNSSPCNREKQLKLMYKKDDISILKNT